MLLSTLLASKAAIAVGSAVVVLGGGTAAVAAVHVLPAALDHASDVTVGASGSTTGAAEPGDDGSSSTGASSSSGSSSETSTSTQSAEPAATPSTTDRGPDATGPAAFGLCTAYSHGGLPPQSVAYQALARAAAPGTVEEYCATVKHPGGKPAPTTSASSSTKHHGKPSTVPSPGTTHGRSGSHSKPSGAPGRPSTAPAR